MTAIADTKEQRAATEAIHALKARYCQLLDAKDWPAWQALFAPGATLETGSRSARLSRLEGPEAIAAAISSLLAGAVTLHRVCLPEIELLSATAARGVWAMEDQLDWPAWKAVPLTRRTVTGRGYYRETYAREPDGWRFRAIRLIRTEVVEQRTIVTNLAWEP